MSVDFVIARTISFPTIVPRVSLAITRGIWYSVYTQDTWAGHEHCGPLYCGWTLSPAIWTSSGSEWEKSRCAMTPISAYSFYRGWFLVLLGFGGEVVRNRYTWSPLGYFPIQQPQTLLYNAHKYGHPISQTNIAPASTGAVRSRCTLLGPLFPKLYLFLGCVCFWPKIVPGEIPSVGHCNNDERTYDRAFFALLPSTRDLHKSTPNLPRSDRRG